MKYLSSIAQLPHSTNYYDTAFKLYLSILKEKIYGFGKLF